MATAMRRADTRRRPSEPVGDPLMLMIMWSLAMRLASRKFVIDAEGGVFRLADATFYRMLRDEANHRLPEFSGQRVRMAS